jgi:hypothetical protein
VGCREEVRWRVVMVLGFGWWMDGGLWIFGDGCANGCAVWFSSRRDESATITLDGCFEGMILGEV